MRRLTIAAALAVVALSGCSTGAVDAPAAPRTTTATAVKAPVVTNTVPPVRTAEDRFWSDLSDTPGLSSTVSRSDTVGVAHSICAAVGAGNTRAKVIETMTSTGRFDEAAANVVTDLALKHLCPTITFPLAPPVPAGPATTITAGVYEVGVDMLPGKWKAPGEGKCYWARKKNDDSQAIIDNHYQPGPAAVVVKAGELFETNNCGTWQHQP